MVFQHVSTSNVVGFAVVGTATVPNVIVNGAADEIAARQTTFACVSPEPRANEHRKMPASYQTTTSQVLESSSQT